MYTGTLINDLMAAVERAEQKACNRRQAAPSKGIARDLLRCRFQ